MDTALHTHTGVVPALSTMGRPETAEGGETAEDGQLETNGQNDMMVEGGPGGGITSQHHAEDGRRSVLPVIACSPSDATDVVVSFLTLVFIGSAPHGGCIIKIIEPTAARNQGYSATGYSTLYHFWDLWVLRST